MTAPAPAPTSMVKITGRNNFRNVLGIPKAVKYK